MFVTKPDSPSKTIHVIASHIINGLIIFLLPTIISYPFTLINSYDDSTPLKYYNETALTKIKSLEKQYEEEQKANKAKQIADLKEANIKKQEEEKKRELLEETRKQEESSSNSNPLYNGDTISGGTYGSIIVTNGVFNIPNKRATSDADIPKQSAEYGLNPIFWERLNKLINDEKSKGYNITVTSGWRSYSSQLILWNSSTRLCSVRNNWTACPGDSRHGFGIAADLAFNGTGCGGSWNCNATAKCAHAIAESYGLTFRLSWETWHIEPIQVTGGSFGPCTAAC